MADTVIAIRELTKVYTVGKYDSRSFFRELSQKRMLRQRQKRQGGAVLLTDRQFLALNGINLSVKRGEALGVIGRNGSGKSTLLKLLSRVTAPTSGTIEFRGKTASLLEVGTGFNPEMTGRENIYLNGAILGMSIEEIDSKMDQIIEFSECEAFIDTPVKRYSSGMYVKLAFSVSVHLDSDILIMDEVLSVGDTVFQQKCLARMNEAAKHESRTVLFVSHSMEMVRNLCTRCVVLEKGRVLFDGDVEDAIIAYTRNFEPAKTAAATAAAAPKEKEPEFKSQKIISPSPEVKKRASLLSLRVLNEGNLVCAGKEKLRVELSFNCAGGAEYLLMRFVFRNAGLTPIGMGISPRFDVPGPGVYTKLFETDISVLCEGKYTCDLYIGQNNDENVQAFDSAKSAFGFCVFMNMGQKTIKWSRTAWGDTVLPVDVTERPPEEKDEV